MAGGTHSVQDTGRTSEITQIFAAFEVASEMLALGHAAALRNAEPGHTVRQSECVWHALRSAMETLARLPDREAGWLYAQRSCMTEIALDYSEQIAAFENMKRRIEAGDVSTASLVIRATPPSPRSITRMDEAFDWWRYLQGRNRARDWKILCRLAAGQKAGAVARAFRVSPRLVHERREFQCSAIANGLAARFEKIGELFPSS